MPNTIDEIRKEFTREITLREYEERKQQEQLMNMSANPRYTTLDVTAMLKEIAQLRGLPKPKPKKIPRVILRKGFDGDINQFRVVNGALEVYSNNLKDFKICQAYSIESWRIFGPIYAELQQLGFEMEVFENE